MSITLDLSKRDEFLHDKNYVKNLKDVTKIIRKNGVAHNVKFKEVYNKYQNVWLFDCLDENNNTTGVLAIDSKNLIVGPSVPLKQGRVKMATTPVFHAIALLMNIRANLPREFFFKNTEKTY